LQGIVGRFQERVYLKPPGRTNAAIEK